MTATAHALIGGAIAASVPNPSIGITLAALSHPLVDMIPHWDFGIGWRKKNKILLFLQGCADLVFGIVVTFLFFGHSVNAGYLILCILVSESWDILQSPYWLLNWKFPPFSTFYNIQHTLNSKAKLPLGILTQAATVGVTFLALRAIR